MTDRRRERLTSHPRAGGGRRNRHRQPRPPTASTGRDSSPSSVDYAWDDSPRRRQYSPRAVKRLAAEFADSSDDRSACSDESLDSLVSSVTAAPTFRQRVVGTVSPFLRKLNFLRSDAATSTVAPSLRSTTTRGPAGDPDEYGEGSECSSASRVAEPKSLWYLKTNKSSARQGYSASTLFNRPTTPNSIFAVVSTAVILLSSGALLYLYVNWSNERLVQLAQDKLQHQVVSKRVVDGGKGYPRGAKNQRDMSIVAIPTTKIVTENITTDVAEEENVAKTTQSPAVFLEAVTPRSLSSGCLSRFCLAHSSFLEDYLDWTVDPCSDFYSFVCPHQWRKEHWASSDVRLSDQVDRALFQTLRGHVSTNNKRGPKMAGLLGECWKKVIPKSTTRQFRELLEHVGLPHWPYRNNKDKLDVWKVASTLIRDLKLDTLMAVDITRNIADTAGISLVVNEPDLLIGQYGTKERRLPRWYVSALVSCFRKFRDIDQNVTVKGVREFSERLSEITSSRGEEAFFASRYRLTTVASYAIYKPLFSFVMRGLLTIRDKTRLLVKSDRYMRALKSVLQMTKTSDVLNYLDAKIDMAKMASLGNDIKSHVVVSVGNLPWLSSTDKIKSKNIMSSVHLRIFYPLSFKKHRGAGPHPTNLPEAVSGRLLHSYRESVREANMNHYKDILENEDTEQSKLSSWKGSIFDTYPTFDVQTNTIYVPVAMVDLSELSYEDSFGVQVPRIGSRIIMSLLQAAHQRSYSFGRVEWSLNSTMSLHNLEICLATQYNNISNEMAAEKIRGSLTEAYNFLDNTALTLAYNIFQEYLRNRRVSITDTSGIRGLTTRHLFYVLYAASMCEKQSTEMTRQEFEEDTYSQPRLRVNIPLQNSARFANLWNCSANAAMNPQLKCPLWRNSRN
ncbi:hypothetical protein IscW_ISCW020266 [Ixodes scapularis]|uniref:Uncharacterized protein n=1 Tax=Ixodes scapularis TaxID=6945 RepID=B7PYL6_IXOSC|nr:hypothetical protein IscW_ISCW020266 [Ixodes scapularis]|eukprot:XP_002403319.1 hypothetical protein IscW_ISCW020266 [Ixodes scapularis]